MTITFKQLVLLLFSSLALSPALAAGDSQPAGHYETVFADLAMHCMHQQFPNVIKHKMNTAADVKTPRELYPAFYGCYDWHSSVHGHWLLVRMLNTAPDKVDTNLIKSRLGQSFRPENLEAELQSYTREGNRTFERPYGLAWYLQLTTELREASFSQAKTWLQTLQPLESAIVAAMTDWLHKLAYPIRTGEHSQTAFAFGLMLDWSRHSGNTDFEQLLTRRVRDYYLEDRDCPIAYEPSGQDFLSPCLAEADLMRRVLPADEFRDWLTDFFPRLHRGDESWITPATVSDKSDGKLAHLDGLNLSRAWMLEGIISALDDNDPRVALLESNLKAHRKAGLDAVIGDMHYMGSHWLGSFAAYLETRRGIAL
ncbi:DUF2891 family protein [Seongchinamella sediminis]|uniref:DUF2891 family protein n=1 Tax=Seongchinamella sediminis TaxID=2283635 RepID=A0A3L7DZP5_9GAMM|nr:DUF2891 domain-containing protein [Seongchinamella sediminis]RLQ22724.1 DUF2891 family protein [Seongchinamella sediminis]